MITRNAIVVFVAAVLLVVSIALILASNKKAEPDDSDSRPSSISEAGSITVSSPLFESFLIRSDETEEGSTRPIFFGESLYEMKASGEVVEIAIPDNKGVLSAQYSPNKKNVALSFCEFEGRKLCGLYLYNLETQEMTYLTEDEPDSDYADPVWVSDEEIAYLFDVAGTNEAQKFVPFRAPLRDPYSRTMIGTEGDHDCLFIDANSGGEVVVGCRNRTENITTVIHYNNQGGQIQAKEIEGLLTSVEISDDGDVFVLLTSEQTNNITKLFSFEKNDFILEQVRSITVLSSDVFAYTESLFEKYFIVSEMDNEEIIKSPGSVLLDVK